MAERALRRLKKASHMRHRISTPHERKQTMKKIHFFNAKMMSDGIVHIRKEGEIWQNRS